MKVGARRIVPGSLAGLLPVPRLDRTPRGRTELERLHAKARREKSEQLLACQMGMSAVIRRAGKIERNFEFHPVRGWKFDIALPEAMLAAEIDGGGFVEGRHSQGPGIEEDCIKFAEAMILGWRLLRCTPRQVKAGEALRWLELILERSDGR